MAYEYYNPNPMSRNVGDCSVRAISKALDTDWETAYIDITMTDTQEGIQERALTVEEETPWEDTQETDIQVTMRTSPWNFRK